MKSVQFLTLFMLVTLVGCGSNSNSSESQESTAQIDSPGNTNGLVATIKSLGSTSLLDKPLRLEHTITNTTNEEVVLYDLENGVVPLLDGEWGTIGDGLTGGRPNVTLSPGQSVSRWVELTRGQPTSDWPCSVIIRSEAGMSHKFTTKGKPRELRVRVWYSPKIFTGKTGGAVDTNIMTPWITIQLVKN